MSEAIIRLDDVKRFYQMGEVTVRALNGVSLSVSKGEFVAIIGKSGSGKSTLVNQVGCLDTPTEGAVYLSGQNIANMDESDLARVRGRKIGFIFQTFNLMPTLNVEDNVGLPLLFQRVPEAEAKRRVSHVLKLVDLEDRRDHKPGELSGGQRQRVAIARALVNNPEVILADEPTGNLDSKTGKQIIDFLLKLNKEEKVTIILVTHDDDIAGLAKRTVILSDGKIIKEQVNSEKSRNEALQRINASVALKTNGVSS
ncbi:MAG: ABC transporter ATP-binding protein [Candidatus Woesearchaeota archaeon]|nr:MAG: ABC transporter ATP-binding protein [Candidatus Woesearchaeota archaeon]